MGDTKLCYGCFEPIGEETKCPVCGYKQKSPYSPSYIAPGTMLSDRYMVGKLISHNGEGATYLAFDTVISCKIFIKEYMPDALCTRVKGSPVINVNHNNVAQYKALMAEFTELNKKLAKLRSLNHINPVLDLFSENNTTYAVFEYIEGVNLIQYLKDNAGELTWKQVSKMFPPLFTSLGMLHNAGIVHRGISPQTIYVTTKGELKLTDFCIAAVRTTKTELNSEIFKGYAAPEQYSPSSWQGAWTDVYGICSVLYRILTGCMPTEAPLRNEESELTPPIELNPEIPENVSDAIMDGLKIAGDERIQTVTELVTRIFVEPSEEEKQKTVLNFGIKSKIASFEEETYDEDEDYERNDYSRTPSKRNFDEGYEQDSIVAKIDKIKLPLFIGFLAIAVVVIIIIFIATTLNAVNKNNDPVGDNSIVTTTVTTEPEVTPEVTDDDDTYALVTKVPTGTGDVTSVSTNANANIQMPNLVGRQYDEVKLLTLTNDLDLVAEYVFDADHVRGEIIEQDVKEGTWLSSGAVVKLKVSNGNGSTEVPDYKRGPMSCYPIDEYLAILDNAGIKYRAIPEVNNGYASGYVIKTEPPAGTVIDSLSGDVLIVHFTDNSGNGEEKRSEGVSADATAPTQAAQ